MNKNKINLMSKIVAFTLAETLLTITIIGVVAALTIPTLKEHTDGVAEIGQLRKAYSTASAATAALEIKYGDLQFWDWHNDSKIAEMYGEQLNYMGDANVASIGGGSIVRASTDGMFWTFYDGASGGNAGYNPGGCALVDVNGDKPPNRQCADRFGFRISQDGVKPFGADGNGNAPWDCTGKALKDGKIEAFKQ